MILIVRSTRCFWVFNSRSKGEPNFQVCVSKEAPNLNVLVTFQKLDNLVFKQFVSWNYMVPLTQMLWHPSLVNIVLLYAENSNIRSGLRDQVVKAVLNWKWRCYCVALDTKWKSVTELPSARRLLILFFLNWQDFLQKKIYYWLALLMLIYHQDTKQKQNWGCFFGTRNRWNISSLSLSDMKDCCISEL